MRTRCSLEGGRLQAAGGGELGFLVLVGGVRETGQTKVQGRDRRPRRRRTKMVEGQE